MTIDDPTFERLWTARDVAIFLQCSEKSIYRYRQRQGLPTIDINGSLRFRPAAVRAWAEAREDVMAPPKRVRSNQPSVPDYLPPLPARRVSLIP